ncbi:MAG: histidine phosphatase family protein [Bacteroidota bacterium]
MKTLVLCRHAKSDWPEGVPDIQRPLKNRGINDATYLAKLLAEQDFEPDLILSSPAKRARTTADIFAAELGFARPIQEERSIYYEGVASLIQLIKDLPPRARSVMIFGHNPTFEDTVRTLLYSQARFEMPTCGMACFEIESFQWDQVNAMNLHLRWLLVPRLKRKGI